METVEQHHDDQSQQPNADEDLSNCFVRILVVAGQTYSPEQARHVLGLISSGEFSLIVIITMEAI